MNTSNQQPLLNDFKHNKFLCLDPYNHTGIYRGQVLNFHGSDDEPTFEENLKKLPADWSYRTKKVEYKINSYGYRTEEFNKIDWKNSIVLFGCSNAFGIGLAEDETIAHLISVRTGRPVVNLGAPGSSMTLAYANSLALRKAYPAPAAVIDLWTSYERLSLFNRTSVGHHGVWKNTLEFKVWNQNEVNPLMYALIIQRSNRLLWEDRSRYIECTFFKHTADALNCQYFKFDDHARDNMHPGPKANKTAADWILQQLTS